MVLWLFSGDFMNNSNNLHLRFASEKDAEALSLIYKPYVEKTAVSFEYIPPSKDEFGIRIAEKIKNYPFIVAEYNGEIAGYTYASQFMPRPAYQHSVETTLYLSHKFHKKGIGKSLYLALEKILTLQNVISLNACIACADVPDETLNNNSMLFHSKMGYRYVGRFNASGYKFGRFYDMIWMEKLISEPSASLDEFLPFSSIYKDAEAVLSEFNKLL